MGKIPVHLNILGLDILNALINLWFIQNVKHRLLSYDLQEVPGIFLELGVSVLHLTVLVQLGD